MERIVCVSDFVKRYRVSRSKLEAFGLDNDGVERIDEEEFLRLKGRLSQECVEKKVNNTINGLLNVHKGNSWNDSEVGPLHYEGDTIEQYQQLITSNDPNFTQTELLCSEINVNLEASTLLVSDPTIQTTPALLLSSDPGIQDFEMIMSAAVKESSPPT